MAFDRGVWVPDSSDWLNVENDLTGDALQKAQDAYSNPQDYNSMDHGSSYGGVAANGAKTSAGMGGDHLSQVNNLMAAQARQRFWQGQTPGSIAQQRFITQGLAGAMSKVNPGFQNNISPQMANYIKQFGQGSVMGAGGSTSLKGYNPGGIANRNSDLGPPAPAAFNATGYSGGQGAPPEPGGSQFAGYAGMGAMPPQLDSGSSSRDAGFAHGTLAFNNPDGQYGTGTTNSGAFPMGQTDYANMGNAQNTQHGGMAPADAHNVPFNTQVIGDSGGGHVDPPNGINYGAKYADSGSTLGGEPRSYNPAKNDFSTPYHDAGDMSGFKGGNPGISPSSDSQFDFLPMQPAFTAGATQAGPAMYAPQYNQNMPQSTMQGQLDGLYGYQGLYGPPTPGQYGADTFGGNYGDNNIYSGGE